TNNNETQKIVVKEGPDVIPSTLSVDPTDPHEDTMVEFSCWVSNVGGWDSGNINVTFSVDGEPVGYGEAPSLSPGGSPVEINHMWLAEIEGKALSQVRTVSVSVTEDSGYETITGNNSASTTITIQKPAELSVADLTLSSSTEYLQVNQSIDITADIMNSGGEDITDANVVFYKGEPSSGNIIDSALVSVPADSNQSVTVSWETQDRGNHWIYVTVSEDQASVKAPIFSEDYQYDLIVDDENSPYEINGNFGINGFIVVKETGRLIIEGERGQAELDMMMDNPGEFSIFVTDNGQMTLSNTVIYSDLDFDIIVDEQGTFTSSQNSFIYPSAKIHGTDDCSLNFMDSEVESYIDIKGGTFTSEGTSFNSPSLDIAPSRIDCTNSSFADDLNDFNDTRGSLTAVEVDSIDMTGNSRIMLYRWLEVNTVSNSSISINGAEVVISSQLTDYQASGVSDSDGMVYIPALTNILTSGDFTFVGNYLIDSTYSVDSGEYTIDPTVQMKLPDYPSTENIIPVTLRFETLYIPDLHVEDESVTTDIGEVTVGQPVQISAEIENLGEADASDVNVRFYLDGVDEPIGEEVISIRSGEIETSSITWTSTMDETMDEHTRTIRVYVDPNVSPINDANVANNEGETSITVKSLPNPEFTSDINLMVDEEVIDPINITEGDELNISFSVLNSGGTDLINTSVRIQNTDYTIANKKMDILVDEEVTVYTDWLVDISGGDNLVVSLNTSEYSGISISQSLGITIDPLQLEFQEPDIPDTKQEKNQQITIQGTLLRRQDNKPMEGITVNASLVDENDNEVGSIASGETNANGRYTIFITTPNKAGEYRVQLTAEHPNFEDAHVSDQSFQVTGGEGGIPLWLIAVILVAAAGASFGGILLYLRYKGLGEWVECGECGATIPADSNKCPKCGTEFEMDTVKCSECGEWIPADADACPHCGAEFIMTGEEVEEYSDRMKEQYEKYVDKHRKEAKKELGDEFSEDNFMDWWEEQPTYLTFDEWLEREEERRRKGGIECPECGALNSVDDAICHKCGSTLIHVGEEKPSPGLPELEDEEEKPKKKVKPKKKIEKPEKKEEKAPEKAEEETKKVKPKKVQKKVKKKPKRVAKKVKKKVVKKPGEEEEE
ncbi:MAG: CARDB domain-containing protein, partial [Thermoplasmatota archaeon]